MIIESVMRNGTDIKRARKKHTSNAKKHRMQQHPGQDSDAALSRHSRRVFFAIAFKAGASASACVASAARIAPERLVGAEQGKPLVDVDRTQIHSSCTIWKLISVREIFKRLGLCKGKEMESAIAPYSGYVISAQGQPETAIVQGGKGTPGGEYLRRFWQPVAYEREIENNPLRVRIMGEDLVVFRDLSGDIGVLHLHCSHRGTSLEFGRVEERGIRCCYHGRVFGVDGSVLEMPGEHAAERLCRSQKQGAYPVHLFAGLVFAYMGPAELKPPFPRYDRFELPGIRLEAGVRMPFACNWVQVKENAMDPAHTAVLHAWEGMFASEFGKFPEITWTETPTGLVYFASRAVDDKVWVRSTDILAPNIHSISSVFEDGRHLKDNSPPWITIWTVPVDDDSCINFVVEHLAEDDTTPVSTRHRAMTIGQNDHRPYEQRQKVPGDYDAIVSQGGIAPHSLEHLGSLDRGVVMFRRLLRQEILRVQEGGDPAALFRGGEVIPTYGTDRVVPVTELGGDPRDSDVLMAFAEKSAQSYLKRPPLLNGKLSKPVAMPARAAA